MIEPNASGHYTTEQVAEIFGVGRGTAGSWPRRWDLPVARATSPMSTRRWPIEVINAVHARLVQRPSYAARCLIGTTNTDALQAVLRDARFQEYRKAHHSDITPPAAPQTPINGSG